MNPVSEDLLLTTAQIAATLIGLLLVGVFFYVETGFRRLATVGPQAGPFLRATTKLTLLLYSLVLGLSLALIALERLWVTVLYVLLSVCIVTALVAWTLRYRDLRKVLAIPRDSPWYTWLAVLGMLVLPWVLDGRNPSREALTLTLFVAGAVAFMSTTNLLLTSFDLAALEKAAREGDGQPSRRTRLHPSSRDGSSVV